MTQGGLLVLGLADSIVGLAGHSSLRSLPTVWLRVSDGQVHSPELAPGFAIRRFRLSAGQVATLTHDTGECTALGYWVIQQQV